MRTAATTLCDWLSGRRRCAVSRPVRVELDGSVNSDVDDGIGGRGAASPKFLRLAVFRTTVQSGAAGRSVPKRMSTVAASRWAATALRSMRAMRSMSSLSPS